MNSSTIEIIINKLNCFFKICFFIHKHFIFCNYNTNKKNKKVDIFSNTSYKFY